MPFKSRRQQRYFYANRKKLERQGVDVGEWSGSTDYENLPERKKTMNKKTATIQPPQEAQSRLQTLLSSPQYQYARTGALVGGGASLLRALLQNRGLRDTIGSGLASAGIGAGAGLGLHALGTGAGYNMPHRKTAALKQAARSRLLRRAALLGRKANRVIDPGGFGASMVPGRKILRNTLGIGGYGAGVGGIVGAARQKDEGESRLGAILRSALTGGAVGSGVGGGASLGTRGGVGLLTRGMVLGNKASIAPILAGISAPYAGGALGGVGGYRLARRQPQEKTSAARRLIIRKTVERAVHGH